MHGRVVLLRGRVRRGAAHHGGAARLRAALPRAARRAGILPYIVSHVCACGCYSYALKRLEGFELIG